jgi:hypothetical protein
MVFTEIVECGICHDLGDDFAWLDARTRRISCASSSSRRYHLGATISAMIVFGYPFLLIFGFPAPYSSKITRRFSIVSLAVLSLICIASSIESPWMDEDPITTSWVKITIAVPVQVIVFAPFFVATHVLGEVRRSLGIYKPFDSIGACISLFFFPFGGMFFLHRSVASAVQSLPISTHDQKHPRVDQTNCQRD